MALQAAAVSLPDSEAIDAAVRRLVAGELVAFPTETVYGLGADAENPAAVARIYAAKGRPSQHPVIVHLADGADLAYWATEVPEVARQLVAAFWPGPLTLILKRQAEIPDAVSGGQDSIGLRCPAHPVAQALLRAFAATRPRGQAGVAAPSANRFGQVSPTQAEHVRSEFPEALADGLLVLEGGASEVGIESTILDLSRLDTVGPVLLRPGHITPEQIAVVLGCLPAAPDRAAPRASGSLKAHYAPRTPLKLVPSALLATLAAGGDLLPDGEGRVGVISHSQPTAPVPLHPRVCWQGAPEQPQRYARQLYALLRKLDQQGLVQIWLEQPPALPEWAAVNDRVGRAAAAFESP